MSFRDLDTKVNTNQKCNLEPWPPKIRIVTTAALLRRAKRLENITYKGQVTNHWALHLEDLLVLLFISRLGK